MDLTKKRVMITGAARGIGLATALELANASADIVGVGLVEKDLKTGGQTANRERSEVSSHNPRHLGGQRFEEEVAESPEGIDVLINNADVLPSGPFAKRNFHEWRRTL